MEVLQQGLFLHPEHLDTIAQAETIIRETQTNLDSVIVDMLEMEEDDRLEFVYEYCKRLWELNRYVKRPMGIVLEEAQHFIPESKSNAPSMKMLKQFALEGRKFGFTIILSSQRVAEVNKTVLGMCGIVFLHGVDILNDIQAYQGMLPYTLAETKKIALNLHRGEAIVKWIHDGKRSVDQVQIRKRHTFHVGDTPTLSNEPTPELRRLDAELIAELKAAIAPPAKPTVAVVATVESPAAIEAYKQTLFMLETKYEQQNKIHRAGLGLVLMAYGRTIKQLKAQIAQRPPVEASPETTIVETSEMPVLEVSEGLAAYRSPLALTRAINKQRRQFEQTLNDLRKLPRFHQLMLCYLTNYEGQEMELKQIARFIGIAEQTIQRTPPTDLLKRKLLTRRFHRGGPHYYRSTVRSYFEATFPDLNSDDMVEAITRLQRLT